MSSVADAASFTWPVGSCTPRATGLAEEPGHDLRSGPPGAVVVGVDDDACSDAAARWAAEEAAWRHATVHLVHAYRLPAMTRQPEYRVDAAALLDRARRSAVERLMSAENQVRSVCPDLPVVRTAVHGRAAQALRSASTDARLTVVGHSPASRRSRVLMGSVSLSVVSDCRSPVVVVGPDTPRRTGPVVVGYDSSAASSAAVGVALAAAAVRGEELIVVHAWNDEDRDADRVHQLTVGREHVLEQEAAHLSARLATWQQQFPGVRLRAMEDHDRPVTALLHYSTHAGLLVVGTRGRGGMVGMVLGSTSHALASYGKCPVMVVGGR